jgi:hypothetical protein
MDIPVQYAGPADHPQLAPDGKNDDLDILTAHPHPDYRAPIVRSGRVPQSVVRNLLRMTAYANDPEAPETFKALYRGIVWELDKQNSAV